MMLPISDESSSSSSSSSSPSFTGTERLSLGLQGAGHSKPSKLPMKSLGSPLFIYPLFSYYSPKYIAHSISLHPRSCLIVAILFIQILLILLSQSIPFSTSSFYHTTPQVQGQGQGQVSSLLLHQSQSQLQSQPQPQSQLQSQPRSQSQPQSQSQSQLQSPINIEKNNNTSSGSGSGWCEFGKFYIYDDLPSQLNTDIYRECDRLNPWGSLCDKLSNGGFGPLADEDYSKRRSFPQHLSKTWYWTDQFSSEVIFHNRLLSHPCRTLDPSSASAFYIPFYAGLAVGRYLWSNPEGSKAKERDRHCDAMLGWVRNQRPYFNRSQGGWDHFLTMGRITWDFRRSADKDWGSNCIYASGMRNITRLLIERNPWDYFDVGIPYPTGFHPESDDQLEAWQDFVRTRRRRTLFSFAGATRGFIKNDFRTLLIDQCRNYSTTTASTSTSTMDRNRYSNRNRNRNSNINRYSCRLVDCSGSSRCSNGTSEILDTFLDSDFCLQPRGDSFTRRSIFDCMLAGSIPVFFWKRTAYFQYEWYLPQGDPSTYSVFIHRDAVKNGTALIGEILNNYGQEQITTMREKLIRVLPKLIYANINNNNQTTALKTFKDAVDVAVDAVLSRVRQQNINGYKW